MKIFAFVILLSRLDDDLTIKLQSGSLPLEVQLMLEPMWIVRSRYHDCMKPLDAAMEEYLKFRCRLKEIDFQIELGNASNVDIAIAFDQVLRLLNIYEQNKRDLHKILKQVSHQIALYAHASRNDLMWNEMLQLRELDYASFTRKTCTFEHVVTCLFKLDENLKESIRSSVEISKCCASYLLRIAQHFSFTKNSLLSDEQVEASRQLSETYLSVEPEGPEVSSETPRIHENMPRIGGAQEGCQQAQES